MWVGGQKYMSFHQVLSSSGIYTYRYVFCVCAYCVCLFMFLTAGAAEIVRSICLAVAHLHHMHIAHRDLKVMLQDQFIIGGASYTV